MPLWVGHNAPYSGPRMFVGCSLDARWLGLSRGHPVRPRECFRGAPRSAPLRRRSSTGRVGSSPRPPCPPPCICSLCCGVWCPSLVWCQASLFYSGRCGRVCPVGPLLGSLRSLRFKWALVGLSLPPRVVMRTARVCLARSRVGRAVRPSVVLRGGSLRSPRGCRPMCARPLPSRVLALIARVYTTLFVI